MRPVESVDSPTGWGQVPVIGGDISSSVPDPVTGTSATQDQQAATASTQQSIQSIFLPPAPTWTPLLGPDGALTAAWITWFQTLNRKLGGYAATPAEDLAVLESFGNVAGLPPADDHGGFDLQMPQFQQVQDYPLPEMPGGNHLTTWNDWNLSISGAKVPAANFPTWTTLVGNVNAFQFAVNDYLYLESQEFLHDWKEGSDLRLHIHWVTGGLNDATVRGVKWEIEYAVCNPLESGFGVSAFTASTVVSAEVSIPAAQPDRTHRIDSVATIPGAGFRIGSQIVMRLRRIASVTNPAPAANPFAISFGIHYESDTPGSRSIATK